MNKGSNDQKVRVILDENDSESLLSSLTVAELQVLWLSLIEEMKIDEIANYRHTEIQVIKNQRNSAFRKTNISNNKYAINAFSKHVIKPWLLKHFSTYEEIKEKHEPETLTTAVYFELWNTITGESLSSYKLSYSEIHIFWDACKSYNKGEIDEDEFNQIIFKILDNHKEDNPTYDLRINIIESNPENYEAEDNST